MSSDSMQSPTQKDTRAHNTRAHDARAHVIVVGNEKGGAGKTTTAMHIIASLLALQFRVASMDVDSRQLSLSRYLENRNKTIASKGLALPVPEHAVIAASKEGTVATQEEEEQQAFLSAYERVAYNHDFIVIDTPGSHSFLSRLVHSFADTVITPINDSFVDLDVLARIESDELKIEKPGIYSQMVWEQKLQRAKRDRGSINWVVMRNRLTSIDAKNKRNMAEVLTKLAQRIGFRHAPGFSERVIFRELFLLGLTLMDVKEAGSPITFSLSHVAARQELRDFLKFLQIPAVNERLAAGDGVNASGNSSGRAGAVESENSALQAMPNMEMPGTRALERHIA